MVFEVVNSDGGVMPPFIFPHGLRLNMEVYMKCLEEVVLACIEKGTIGNPYI